MFRALFSTRYLQQLLREGKFTNEYLYFFSMLIYLVVFPGMVMAFLYFYFPETLATFHYPILLYLLLLVATTVIQLISWLLLQYFATIFNYQEQRYLYLTTKTLYRFYHGLLLGAIIPVVWYGRFGALILFGYLPLFAIIYFAFFILFLRNINGIIRIHFFIYFCSLEILPYLLLAKWLVIIYN